MKIALVAPLEEPVPPTTYGGTELVVYNLAEELVELGHDVTVFASGDSTTSARLVPIFETSVRRLPEAQDARRRDALKFVGIGRVIDAIHRGSFDVVHNHMGWRLMAFTGTLKAPVVTTLHGPLDDENHVCTYRYFADMPYVSITDAQRRPAPDLNFVATVYNGIDCDKFPFNEQPQDYFAFLGRMSPQKNPVEAIRAAKACDVRLIMAAKVDSADREYFERDVKPLIDGKQIQYIGEVGHEGKCELLKNARALLFPIDWEEPFGLVMPESMATGTPVIAYRRGSVPEVVSAETGVICDTFDEFCGAMKSVDNLSRQACRDFVCTHFDRRTMALGYLQAYETVIESYEPATTSLEEEYSISGSDEMVPA